MGNRTSGYGDKPDFSAVRSYRVQQEKPDGSLWSVVFYLDEHEQFASKQYFPSETEADACGMRGIQVEW